MTIVTNINEHERLSNIAQNLGKEQCFNYSSSFHNHRRIFNDEHNSSYNEWKTATSIQQVNQLQAV
jgi:hypothetical protein